MKAQTTLAIAAAVLLSGAVTGSAATIQPRAEDSLSLSSIQQKTAWTDLNSASNQKAPAGYDDMAGTKVPHMLRIKAVPDKATRDVSPLRPYDFAKVSGKILIVNPTDRTVAAVIGG